MTQETKPKRRGGCTPKPFLEKKIMVYCTVKRKYHKIATEEIREICKKYRYERVLLAGGE